MSLGTKSLTASSFVCLLLVSGCSFSGESSTAEGIFVPYYVLVIFFFLVCVIGIPTAFYLGKRWIAVPWLRFLLVVFAGYVLLESMSFAWQFKASLDTDGLLSLEQTVDSPNSAPAKENDNRSKRVALNLLSESSPFLWRFVCVVALLIVFGFFGREDQQVDPVDYLLNNNLTQNDVLNFALKEINIPLDFRIGICGMREFDKASLALAKKSFLFWPCKLIRRDKITELEDDFLVALKQSRDRIVYGIKAASDSFANQYSVKVAEGLEAEIAKLGIGNGE